MATTGIQGLIRIGAVVVCLFGLSGSATARQADGAHPLLYVTNQDAGTVSVVDTMSDRVVSTLDVAPGPAVIAAAPDGKRLFITHPDEGKITVLEGADLRSSRICEVKGEPSGSRPRMTGGSMSLIGAATWSRCSMPAPAGRKPRSAPGSRQPISSHRPVAAGFSSPTGKGTASASSIRNGSR
nr:hypothetical protein [Methyloligella halotolerans]